MSQFEERPKTVVKEEVTLDKFEGDSIVERVHIVNGAIIKIEKFDKDGNILIGGN